MINLILKKLPVLFVLTLLVLFTPAISGNNDAMALCSDIADEATCNQTVDADEGRCRFDTLTTTCRPVVGRTTTADDNALVDTLCNIFSIATGNGGKAFAAFAIISLGIGFFTGKVSWGLMIGVAAGIAAMFGAPTIVAAISGGEAFDCGAAPAPAPVQENNNQ